MRILHVYRTYFPNTTGGLEEAIRQICLSTVKYGCKNTIFSLSNTPGFESNEEGEIYFERSPFKIRSCNFGGYSSVKKFIELSSKADLVVFHFPWPFGDFLKLFLSKDTPSIVVYHSDIVRQKYLFWLYYPLMRFTLKNTHRIVCTSENYSKSSSILNKSSLKNKLEFIPLCLDSKWLKKFQVNQTIKKHDLKLHTNDYFLFIGVLRYYKGLEYLIKASVNIKLRVVIVGSGSEFASLVKLARDLNALNVTFIGQVSNLEKWTLLKNCRAVVLPSHLRSEAFGVVLLEASCMGKPMISTALNTGTSYVNIDRETGFVVKPASVSSLQTALKKLSNSDKLCDKFGKNAKLRFDKNFTSKVVGKKYFDLFSKIVK